MQPYSNSSSFLIHSWKNVSSQSDVGKSLNRTPNHFNNRLSFISENLTLLIMAVQQQDSGLYFLEVTEDTGKVWRHKFQVSVFGESSGQLMLHLWLLQGLYFQHLSDQNLCFQIVLRSPSWWRGGRSWTGGCAKWLCPAQSPEVVMWAMLGIKGLSWFRHPGTSPNWRSRLMSLVCTHTPAMSATLSAGQTTPFNSHRAVWMPTWVSGALCAVTGAEGVGPHSQAHVQRRLGSEIPWLPPPGLCSPSPGRSWPLGTQCP